MRDEGQDIRVKGPALPHGCHLVVQEICMRIDTMRNSPQGLWVGVHDFAVTNCVRCQSGLLRDVEDFCFAVFDCLEPNASREEREQRMIHVGALAVRMGCQNRSGRQMRTA